jgi:hypothetical protein
MFIKIKGSVRFEVLTVATMKSTVICDLMPSLTLEVEAICSCEKTSVGLHGITFQKIVIFKMI